MPGRYWPLRVTSTSGSARLKVLAQDQAGWMNRGTASSNAISPSRVAPLAQAMATPVTSKSATQ